MKNKKYKKSFRYEECEAKLILEKYVSDRYSSILLKDKPDLQDETNNIGIEVTSSIPPEKRRAINNWIEECESNGYNVDFWDAYECSFEEIKDKPEKNQYNDFLHAFIRKRNKLSSGGYEIFETYDLFILSEEQIFLEKIPELLQTLVELNNVTPHYSCVYMYTQCMLITFDLNNVTYKIDIIDEQHEIAVKAESIVEE